MYQDFQIYQKVQPKNLYPRISKARTNKISLKEKLPNHIDYSIALQAVISKVQPLNLQEIASQKKGTTI